MTGGPRRCVSPAVCGWGAAAGPFRVGVWGGGFVVGKPGRIGPRRAVAVVRAWSGRRSAQGTSGPRSARSSRFRSAFGSHPQVPVRVRLTPPSSGPRSAHPVRAWLTRMSHPRTTSLGDGALSRVTRWRGGDRGVGGRSPRAERQSGGALSRGPVMRRVGGGGAGGLRSALPVRVRLALPGSGPRSAHPVRAWLTRMSHTRTTSRGDGYETPVSPPSVPFPHRLDLLHR
jgi:hypothetical protein